MTFHQVNDEDEDEDDDLPTLIGIEDNSLDTIAVNEDPAPVLGTPRIASGLESFDNINSDHITTPRWFSELEPHALEIADVEADASVALLNLHEEQTPAQPVPMDMIRASAPPSSASPFLSNFAAAASLWGSFERRGLDVD